MISLRMANSKFFKISGIVLLAILLTGAVWYWQLPNRHKAIIKTTAFHKLHIIDADWNIDNAPNSYKMISPSFLIDGIYKSMEGPKAAQLAQADRMLVEAIELFRPTPETQAQAGAPTVK